MNKKAPDNRSSEKLHIDSKIAITIIVTFALFFVCAIGMFVCIALDNADSGSGYVASGGDGGGKAQGQQKPVSTEAKKGEKTGITLPSATASGTYLCPSDANTADMSADTEIKSGARFVLSAFLRPLTTT